MKCSTEVSYQDYDGSWQSHPCTAPPEGVIPQLATIIY